MMRWIGLVALVLAGCNSQTTVIKTKKVLTVSPSLVDVGTLVVGDTATATIDLTHVEGGEIKVVTVSMLNVAGDWFSTDETNLPTVAIDGTEQLTITYAPSDIGYHRAQLTVYTDEEENNEHVVDLRGAAAYPSADVFPSLVDFGPVSVGNTADRSVTVRNSGTVRLDVLGSSFSNPAFSSTQGPVSLDAGEEVEIPVSFTASTEDPVSGELTLDLGAASTRTVELRANDCEHGEAALYDTDADGFATCGGDCDDTRAEVRPGEIESCDTLDNNCDGTVDETTDCYDDDLDGYTETDGDCNDGDDAIFPGATEDNTNGIDDDCDGTTDLGAVDLDYDGYGDIAGDCNDADATIYPGAPELVDGLDNDCDGLNDEGTEAYDDDGDGYSEVQGDCDDNDPGTSPVGRERADGVDNNCDGSVDEGTEAADDDGDGFTELGGDCDDANASVSPAILEVSGDGIDNDCDGLAL